MTNAVTALCQFSSQASWRVILSVLLCVVLSIVAISPIFVDESFLSKFWIGGLAVQYLMDANLSRIMFGVGPGNSEFVLGVGAHLLPFVLIIEIGLIGTLFTFVLWLFIVRDAGRSIYPMMFGFCLIGMSFTTFAIPWLYALSAILVYINRKTINERAAPCFGINPGV